MEFKCIFSRGLGCVRVITGVFLQCPVYNFVVIAGDYMKKTFLSNTFHSDEGSNVWLSVQVPAPMSAHSICWAGGHPAQPSTRHHQGVSWLGFTFRTSRITTHIVVVFKVQCTLSVTMLGMHCSVSLNVLCIICSCYLIVCVFNGITRTRTSPHVSRNSWLHNLNVITDYCLHILSMLLSKLRSVDRVRWLVYISELPKEQRNTFPLIFFAKM